MMRLMRTGNWVGFRWLSILLLITLLATVAVPTATITNIAQARCCYVSCLDLKPDGGSAFAGSPFNITVTAYYNTGGIATSYTGTVKFSSTDPAATLPGNYTFTTADAGVHTFSVTLGTPGSWDITVTDTANCCLSDTETWSVAIEPPKAYFSSGAQSEAEDIGTMAVTVELDKTSSLNVTVPFTIDGGSTATDGVDYTISTAISGQVTILAGSLISDAITINVVDDSDVESDETVIINMGTPTNASKGTPDVHTATIENDDTRPGPGPSAQYFTVDFLGKITREKMSGSGRLLNPLDGPSPDNKHLFSMEKDTKTRDENDKIVKKITIREALKIDELPTDTVLVGAAYDFEPTNCVFSKSVSLTLGYDVNQLPDNVASIALAYYDTERGWVELDTERSVVAEVGKLTAPVDHFTTFAILAKVTTTPPGPTPTPTPPGGPTPPGSKPALLGFLGSGDLELSNLSITTSFVKIWELLTFVIRTGEEATITFTTTNSSDQDGIYKAVLKVNGITRDTKEISLASGQTQQVVFTITGNMPGSYSVEVGSLNGEFQSVLWINWWLIIVLAALFVFLSWLAWHYGGKKLVRTFVTEKS